MSDSADWLVVQLNQAYEYVGVAGKLDHAPFDTDRADPPTKASPVISGSVTISGVFVTALLDVEFAVTGALPGRFV